MKKDKQQRSARAATKLRLHRQTIRRLELRELGDAAGGATFSQWLTCDATKQKLTTSD
ncbi:MAG: hypothetical protein Tsb0020_08760 [Haliangiales bacterium]